MYNLEDIKIIHLEITSKCQASCPMCARNIQGGVVNPFISIDEITLSQFKEWIPISVIKNLDRLYMCGNLGDPIIAKDTICIFEYLREINPNIHLGMNTNGSAREKHFWNRLAELKVQIRFALDGLGDTHLLYRIGTDWYKIIENAKTFIKAGGEAIWDMLVFEHNSHQIDACKELSVNLGFNQFVSKNTARFKENKLNVLNSDGQTTHTLYPTYKSKHINTPLKEQSTTSINCKVKSTNSLYISANGTVSPCCWLDNKWMPINNESRIDYMDQIGMHLNLHICKLSDIFNQDIFKKIETTWTSDFPLKTCSKQCGNIDRFNAQFN
jgi:MoaA/NifB/PqqE/SkfB family radical SAM enzyme